MHFGEILAAKTLQQQFLLFSRKKNVKTVGHILQTVTH